MRASVALLALSAAAANAQVQALVTAVNQTIMDISGLNSTLTGIPLDSSDFGLKVFSLLSGSNALQADISNSTTAANSAMMFSQSDSMTVFDALFLLVEPTFELLDNFAAHCPAFARAGLQPTVAQQLAAQQGAVMNETNAIVSKLAQPYAMSASVGGLLFKRGFNSLLSLYGGPLCNQTNACTPATASPGGSTSLGGAAASATPIGGGSGGSGGSATMTAMTSAAAPYTAPSRPASFTGAAVKDKRSPIGSFLAIF